MEQAIWDKGFAQQDLSSDRMTALAKEIGLDMKKFDADVKGKECPDWLRTSQKDLARFGASGTPAFYINGRYLSGAQPLENFRQLIDEELAKADKAIAAGTAVQSYYDKVILGTGLKELKDPDEEEE